MIGDLAGFENPAANPAKIRPESPGFAGLQVCRVRFDVLTCESHVCGSSKHAIPYEKYVPRGEPCNPARASSSARTIARARAPQRAADHANEDAHTASWANGYRSGGHGQTRARHRDRRSQPVKTTSFHAHGPHRAARRTQHGGSK
jgi:hypothetical protein